MGRAMAYMPPGSASGTYLVPTRGGAGLSKLGRLVTSQHCQNVPAMVTIAGIPTEESPACLTA